MKVVNIGEAMVRINVPKQGIFFELPPGKHQEISLRERMAIRQLIPDLGVKVMSDEEFANYIARQPANTTTLAEPEEGAEPESEEGDIDVEEEDEDEDDEEGAEDTAQVSEAPVAQAGPYTYQNLYVKTKSQLWEIARGLGVGEEGTKHEVITRILRFYTENASKQPA